MGNGKAKGSSFERHVSVLLSKWVSNNERDDIYWRSHNSGGRFTKRMSVGKTTEGQDGDLTCISKDPVHRMLTEFCSIECKAYKEINFWNFITETKSGISAFWDQACHQASQANKTPILIVKKNNMPILFFCKEPIKVVLDVEELLRIKYRDEYIYGFKFLDILELDPTSIINQLILTQEVG